MSIGYCSAWPDEMQEAARKADRLEALLTCRKNWIEHIEPSDFDEQYAELLKVQEELRKATVHFDNLRRNFYAAETAYSKEAAK